MVSISEKKIGTKLGRTIYRNSDFGIRYCQRPFFSSVPLLSVWLRASDGLIDTRYILIHPTLPSHKYKKKEDKYKYRVNDKVEDKDKHNICNVDTFCQHLTQAKQLVLVKTNKEGWKQSTVLHIFGKLMKHSLFGSGCIVYDLAKVATLNFRQIATVWTDKL